MPFRADRRLKAVATRTDRPSAGMRTAKPMSPSVRVLHQTTEPLYPSQQRLHRPQPRAGPTLTARELMKVAAFYGHGCL